ncbi:hypothetical protein [Paracoccus aestuarii]|nr:hypothetical protein [Paracoccus aestuarii]
MAQGWLAGVLVAVLAVAGCAPMPEGATMPAPQPSQQAPARVGLPPHRPP